MLLKSELEIEKMRTAGRLVYQILQDLAAQVRPGITTRQLDLLAEAWTRERGGVSAFKDYKVKGHVYPACLCVAVNAVVVHGIPNNRPLEEGDIVGLDYGASVDGYFADSALTVPVGSIDLAKERLLRITQECLWKGIEQARLGNRMGAVSSAIQRHAEAAGFSVVQDLCGHGLGRKPHEPPEVPNFGEPDEGALLQEGMTIAIEPMINAGEPDVVWLDDKWTVKAADDRPSAHFEHTVAITREGPDILTLPRPLWKTAL